VPKKEKSVAEKVPDESNSSRSGASASKVSQYYLANLEIKDPLSIDAQGDEQIAGWVLHVRSAALNKPEKMSKQARNVADMTKAPICTHDAFKEILVGPLLQDLFDAGCTHIPTDLGEAERVFYIKGRVFASGVIGRRSKSVTGVNASPDCVVEFRGLPLTAVEYKSCEVGIDNFKAQEGLNLLGAFAANPHVDEMTGFISNGSEYQFMVGTRSVSGTGALRTERFSLQFGGIITVGLDSRADSPEVQKVVGGLVRWRQSILTNKNLTERKLTPTVVDGQRSGGNALGSGRGGGGSRGRGTGPRGSEAGPSQGVPRGSRGGGAGPSSGNVKKSGNGTTDKSANIDKENADAALSKRVLVWPPLLENMAGRVEMTIEERVAAFLNKN
jgi:hypothetical protein